MEQITAAQITAALVTAFSTGAAFVVKETATEAVKDAYAALKAWITRSHPAVNVDELEKEPLSLNRQEVLAKELERDSAFADSELRQLAERLVVVIRQQPPQIARSVGVDIGHLDNVKATFDDVRAGSDGITVKIASASGGELHFKSVVGKEVGAEKKT